MIVTPGWYRDAFEPNGPVEVIGEAVELTADCVRVVVRAPGRDRMELVRPMEFFTPVTRKGEDGQTVKEVRFTRIIETAGSEQS